MNNCSSIDPLVTPYVDGELVALDRDHVDRHLRACPGCHARVAVERAVRDLMRARKSELAGECAPAGLHTRCAGLAGLKTRATSTTGVAQVFRPAWIAQVFRPAQWRASLAPLALAASLVALVGGAFLYQATLHSARILAAELAADHVKCFALNTVLGTRHAREAVESSMLSSFGWRMRVPDELDRAGFELVGARPCLYPKGKIAHIMYRYQGRPVSIFMLPSTSRRDELVEALGHEAAIWSAGDRTFVLIARESREAVERMTRFARAALQ